MKDELILAGTIHDESINFTFEAWSSRKQTRSELYLAPRVWAWQRDRRRTVKNKIVRFDYDPTLVTFPKSTRRRL